MEFVFNKSSRFFIALALIALLLGGGTWYWRRFQTTSEEHWINVFVHGSFGCVLGLLNAGTVLRGKLEGTQYKKVVSLMRKDPFFYKEQPILEKGLKKIEPTFDFDKVGEYLAAYPIIKAFDSVNLKFGREKGTKNHYYLFGWSGLLNQERRRIEAVRLYNSLSEEVEDFKRRGIEPKIRIISHSHGGNLVLNAGGIHSVLNGEDLPEVRGSLEEFSNLYEGLLETLYPYDEAKELDGQKKWDYFPLRSDLSVDEFIMIGNPIQPETDHLIFSSFFKSILNLYSDSDTVQSGDWVSSRRYYSDRNFSCLREICAKENVSMPENFFELRLLIEPPNEDGNSVIADNQKQGSSWWDYFTWNADSGDHHKAVGPTHREEISIMNPQGSGTDYLKPLPTVVFSKIISAVLKDCKNAVCGEDFLDFVFGIREGKIQLKLTKRDEVIPIGVTNFSMDFVQKLKERALEWVPEYSEEETKEVISKYVSSIA